LSTFDWLLIVSLTCVVGVRVSQQSNLDDFEKGFGKELREQVEKRNQEGPVVINSGDYQVRLDRRTVGPGKRITYEYTLLNTLKSRVNLSLMKKFSKVFLEETSKMQSGLKHFRENRMELHFRYSDMAGEFLYETVLLPGEY
jgi:hypothetical protein